jgi:quercetin dioxygenase-like cupin family protein
MAERRFGPTYHSEDSVAPTYTYPHTISNGAGEELTFVRLVSDPAGDYLEGTNRVQPGSGPPMHVHHLQEEGLTVQAGRIGYQVLGQEPKYASVGETVVFAAGVAHRFWNAGEDELLCTGYIKPAHNIIYFLEAIFDSTRRNGGQQPDPFDAAFLTTRYKSEFEMLEIPPFVRRFIFPVLVLVGRLLGKYKKYADAPEPVRAQRPREKVT